MTRSDSNITAENLDNFRSGQLRELMRTQAGHGDIISHTQTFALARLAEAEIVSRLKPAPRSLLVLGPGDGAELSAILERSGLASQHLSVSALEFNEKQAQAFQKKFPSAELLIHDFSDGSLPLAKRDFDVVQCGFVLNDQTEQGKRAIVRSAYSVLRPGGLFLIVEVFLNLYPNIAGHWPSPEAEQSVNEELRQYYEPYLTELSRLEHFSLSERQAFEQSIHKAWRDALEHKEGREAFDTRETFYQTLAAANFERIEFEHVYNKCWVVSAWRTG